MSIEQILFILFAVLITLGAVSVLVQRNPLYGAFSLVLTFLGQACLYVTLGAELLGVVQVVVYAGAIMVLFVFVIMLLNVKEEAKHKDTHKYLYYLGIPLFLVFISELFYLFSHVSIPNIGGNVGTVEQLGVGLLTDYLLPFEVTSILILMAIIGSMYLAKREKS